jgi:enoyl-CoA hydratase/carnithine racemase
MSYEFIRVSQDGPITAIVLNRPEVMNALHAAAQFELDSALDAFAADPHQWVAILTGAGDRAFCTGGDLKALALDGGKGRPKKGFGGLTSRYDLEKPIIAAVNGAAYGGGFEAALACDVILASETATFCLPEPKRGMAALGGGLHRLARDIGPKRALGMILRASTVTAAEGFQLGFVSAVVPAAELLATAMRWANEMCQLSPMAVRASKDLVYRGLAEAGVEAAMKQQRTYPAYQALVASEDFREGPRAFAEGRPPVWKGR